jgi:hypothetical protein
LLDFQLRSFVHPPAPIWLDNISASIDVVRAMTVVLMTFKYQHPTTSAVTEFQVTLPENIAAPYVTTTTGTGWALTVVIGAGFARLVSALTPTPITVTMTSAPSIEPALACFQPKHRVTSITGTAVGSVPLTGDIYVEAGYNMELAIEPANSIIRLAARPGYGAGYPVSRADPEQASCNEVLMAINGLYADGLGEFQIVGASGIAVTSNPAANEILIGPTMKTDDLKSECQ